MVYHEILLYMTILLECVNQFSMKSGQVDCITINYKLHYTTHCGML